MNRNTIIENIRAKKTYLCVGLDTDVNRLPIHLPKTKEGIVSFNKAIIDATAAHCISYKINTAFYEALGSKGWEAMEETVAYIPDTHFTIADAKRGDIGNTGQQYAKAFFETLKFDAVTVAPYMGEDSIRPFLEYDDKWAIVLGLTSNKGAKDFELQQIESNFTDEKRRATYLYEQVLETVSKWGSTDNTMFVIGATQATEFSNIRSIIPDHFLLVPGIGFQGGSLSDVSKYGMNNEVGLLVNVSRAIIFASKSENFAEEAKAIAEQYHFEMEKYLDKS